jgi:hypothetical protein
MADNPNTLKRPNMGSFPVINAIGSKRQTLGVDKMASKAEIIMSKIAGLKVSLPLFGNKAKQIEEAAKAGIRIFEDKGRMFAEYPTALNAKIPADDAYGFMGKRKLLAGNGYGRKG